MKTSVEAVMHPVTQSSGLSPIVALYDSILLTYNAGFMTGYQKLEFPPKLRL